jgi:hypothetical protein
MNTRMGVSVGHLLPDTFPPSTTITKENVHKGGISGTAVGRGDGGYKLNGGGEKSVFILSFTREPSANVLLVKKVKLSLCLTN